MSDRPLSGIRVVESVQGPLAMIGRYLADLGAAVDRFATEADAGAEAVVANAGKRLHTGNLGSPEAATAIESAHIVIAGPSSAIDLAALRRARPALITMAVSDFGESGPLADWRATGPVLHALSAVLSRSGIRGREPLLPPGDLAYQCAAPQAVFALLGALYRVLRGGEGAHFDFAALDGAVQGLDPGFGINGSATMGKPVGLLLRDRPRAGFQYPIMRCADGYVRICLLAKRQWRGMFRWMGEPAQFASPDFDRTSHRYASADLLPHIAGFFADRLRADLEREGQEYGVPIASVLTLGEFLDSDHAAAREAVTTLADGTRLPNGFLTIDGDRMGPLPAPQDTEFPAAANPISSTACRSASPQGIATSAAWGSTCAATKDARCSSTLSGKPTSSARISSPARWRSSASAKPICARSTRGSSCPKARPSGTPGRGAGGWAMARWFAHRPG